jgi:DNA-binding MarR family transcriptional regulator
VQRTRHPTDRRGVLVELTDEGRRVLDDAVAANSERESELLGGLSPDEQQSLAALLTKLLAGLEPAGGDSDR